MNRLQILDLRRGQIQLLWQADNAVPRLCQPTSFADPLTADDRAELRWYLEKFLGFPYGAERDRAAAIELKLEQWGAALRATLPEGRQ